MVGGGSRRIFYLTIPGDGIIPERKNGGFFEPPKFSDPKILYTSRVFRYGNSIHFQVTCPAKLIFREISTGCPGGEAPRESRGVWGPLGTPMWEGANCFFAAERHVTKEGGKEAVVRGA